LRPLAPQGAGNHLSSRPLPCFSVQTHTVGVALTGKREHIYHAALLDPDQIYALVDALVEAHGEWLLAFK
jgi:alpha-galactosidase